MRTTLSLLPLDGSVFAPDRDPPRTVRSATASTPRPASMPALSLLVPPGRTLHLRRARGARLDVFHGRIWLTQTGQDEDVFLAAGDTFDVRAAGAIVIEADGSVPAWITWGHVPAPLPPRPPGSGRRRALREAVRARLAALRAGLAARRTRLSLRELDDRLMRDAGVPDAVREAVLASRSDRRPGNRERWLARCTW